MVDTQSGITYGRGAVKTVLTRDVFAADLDAERRAREYLIRGLGYVHLNTSDAPGGWVLHFVRSELLADTDRGDKVALDGRWEVGSG